MKNILSLQLMNFLPLSLCKHFFLQRGSGNKFMFDKSLISLILILLLLSVSYVFAKNIDLSTLPLRDSVQLTIYNSEDLTLVKETRQISLKNGVNRLQFSWANTQIDPTSVQLKFISHPMQMNLTNTIFPHEKPQMLYWNIQSSIETLSTIEISYFTSGISWQADYLGIIDVSGEEMALDNFVTITNLSGEDYENAEIRLVIGQINLVERINDLVRKAQQNKDLITRGKQDRLRNNLRKKEARKMMMKPSGLHVMSDMAVAAPVLESMEEEKNIAKDSLSEYTIFSIEGTENIPHQWSKRLRSSFSQAIAIETVYRYRPREYGEYLAKVFIFKNDKSAALGESPLPEGKIQLYKKNQHNSLNYIASLRLKYTSVGEKIELNSGVDRDVHFKIVNLKNWRDNIWMHYKKGNVHRRIDDGRIIVDHRSTVSGWNEHSIFVQQVRNYTDKAIQIEIRRLLYGDVMIKSQLDIKKHNYQTVEIHSKLAGGEEQELLYKTETKKGRNFKQNKVILKNQKVNYPNWSISSGL